MAEEKTLPTHGGKVRRDMDTELMRIAAAYAVIMVHCAGLATGAGKVLNSLAHFCVPVFILISGYYMLRTEKSDRELLTKCAWLFAKLTFWGGAQFLIDCRLGLVEWSGCRRFAAHAVSGAGHLWYSYALITLYLFTPLLYVFCAHADRRLYRRALALTFLFGSLVTTALRMDCFPLLGEIVEKMKVPYLLGFIFLYLMGDYLRRYPPTKPERYVLLGLLGGIGTTVWTFFLTFDQASILSLSFFAPGNLLAGIGVFVGIKALCRKYALAEKGLPFVKPLAACTEGIYLTHMLMAHLVERFLPTGTLALTPWLATPLRVLLIFALCAAFTWLLRHIPLARRLV